MQAIVEIQAKVRRVMKKRGISVADLAAITNRSYSDVRRSLFKPHWWRLNRLLEYAEALEVSVHLFFPSSLKKPHSLTDMNERIRTNSVESRIVSAISAGATVRKLNQIGAANRKRLR